jgi:membrane fusion protein
MGQRLFRQEALDFHREKPLGEVVLIRPPSFSLLTGCALLVAAALIAFALCGHYTRKAHVSGYLAPNKGLIKVYVPQAGTLIEKHVKEGQQVKEGDPLFVLSTEHGSLVAPEAQAAAIAQLRQRRDSLERELAKQVNIDAIERRSLQQRISAVEAEAVQLKREIAIQEQRTASAAKTLQRFQALVAAKFVSEVQAQQKHDELLEQQAKLESLQRGRIEVERNLNGLRLELSSADLKATNQRAAIERNISSVEQDLTEHESRRTILITAPTSGMVTAILVERGQRANPSAPLLSIVPYGATLEAQLLVPSRAIGFVAPAQTVALRYQAFPYQRFGSYLGRVIEISRTLITPSDAALPVQLQEPVYRVTVALDSQSIHAYRQEISLQPGMLLDADIWLDHRRIIEWVFDPLYSVTGRV